MTKEIGQKFGRLTIIGKMASFWHCQCNCGKKIYLKGNKLTPESSCGCIRKAKVAQKITEKSKIRKQIREPRVIRNSATTIVLSSMHYRYEGIVRKVMSSYHSGAVKRSLAFNLNYEDFVNLILGDCFYCGCAPSRLTRSGDFAIIRNGIDRINSKGGYVLGNCVPCCFRCNSAKSDDSYSSFLKWIDKLVAYHIGRPCLPVNRPLPRALPTQ